MPNTAAVSSFPSLSSKRIESIDLLRGLVMAIMALDHVRDYFHGAAYVYDPTDLQHTSVIIFFTRWITHFCAPIFMLLAGVSACLYGMKRGKKALSFFLLTRGLWLVLAEMFIVSLEWTFNPHYPAFILQVIWAFGISMMLLALLIWLPRGVVLGLGLLLVAGHNLLDNVHVPGNNISSLLWALLHDQRFDLTFIAPQPIVGYPILPWLGIICLGYWLGALYGPEVEASHRRRILRSIGLGAIVLFVLIRATNLYGDHSHWSVQKNFVYTILSFLNTSKYPPSLLYILMTLGPALVFLSWAERPLNSLGSKLTIFGRVPMFYYLIHIPLIHGMAVLASMFSGHGAASMVNLTTWVTANPQLQGYGFPLWVVYVIWGLVMVLLFPLCRRFDQYKRAHQAEKKWLSYF